MNQESPKPTSEQRDFPYLALLALLMLTSKGFLDIYSGSKSGDGYLLIAGMTEGGMGVGGIINLFRSL